MTVIVGINAYHADSSACLLKDGRLIAAAEEERFVRIKHWAGLPVHALRYCLREGGIELSDVEIIAINTDPGANILRKLVYTTFRRPDWKLLADRLRNLRKRRSIIKGLETAFGGKRFRGEVHAVEHHLAHMASSFFASPFDRAGVLSVDGFGDFSSTRWGIGEGARIEASAGVYFPHSLGIYYETITHFLGFKRYGDEYKVMGLAPYGRDTFRTEMERLVSLKTGGRFELDLSFFSHHEGRAIVKWEDCEPVAEDYFTSAFLELLGKPREPAAPILRRHMDIARSTQAMYERAIFHTLRELHDRCGSENLVLSGGCAFNSVANGKIYANTPFGRMFVQPAAGDAGGALGAALHAWHVLLGKSRTFMMQHAYWGPEFAEPQLLQALENRRNELRDATCEWRRLETKELTKQVARCLAKGSVVGWFQGRMEWGPRALGNRSILADPRRPDMRDILNEKIKRRESFRPFAPSVLREHVFDWFEVDDDVPFMMKVFKVREDRRAEVAAVVHVDGSGRLQTVEEHQNPSFYRLINDFYELTGVPMLLNTSFNENEPIVHSPDEAIDCFLRTDMDELVLGNYLVSRERTHADIDDSMDCSRVSSISIGE